MALQLSRQMGPQSSLPFSLCLLKHHEATGLDIWGTVTSSQRNYTERSTASLNPLTTGVSAELQQNSLRTKSKPHWDPVLELVLPPCVREVCLLSYTDIWWRSGLERNTFLSGTENIQHKGIPLHVCGTEHKSNSREYGMLIK